MPNLVNAYVVYNGTTNEFVGHEGTTVSINCERLQSFSPRPVWLKRVLAPGDGTKTLFVPTFAPTSAELLDVNTIAGFWIRQDGQDVMIDVTTKEAFQTACDACCGTVPDIIASVYSGNVPTFVSLQTNTFCVTRTDDGSGQAVNDFVWDYGRDTIGKVKIRSNVSNVSKYTVQSLWTLAQFTKILKGTDTVVAGACS